MFMGSSLPVVSALLEFVAHPSEAGSQSSIGRDIGIAGDASNALGYIMTRWNGNVRFVCFFGGGCRSFSRLGTEKIA